MTDSHEALYEVWSICGMSNGRMYMTPETRFHSVVMGLMVLLIFTVLSALVPILHQISPQQRWLAAIIAMLASVGTYRILARIMAGWLRRCRFIKRFFLGPFYLEGTWVGHFIGRAGDVRYVIEVFELELSSLVIRGYSFTEDGAQHGQWTSDSVTIDALRGKLTYTYTCDILTRGVPHQGIGIFDFERESSTHPPRAILGYVADVVDSRRLPVKEVKIASHSIHPDAALSEAKKVKVHKLRDGQPDSPSDDASAVR